MTPFKRLYAFQFGVITPFCVITRLLALYCISLRYYVLVIVVTPLFALIRVCYRSYAFICVNTTSNYFYVPDHYIGGHIVFALSVDWLVGWFVCLPKL